MKEASSCPCWPPTGQEPSSGAGIESYGFISLKLTEKDILENESEEKQVQVFLNIFNLHQVTQ